MSVVTSALGSVLGYLGAEVAEETLFQRLLWPERFYNGLDAAAFFKLVFLFPTSGPLHRAALEVLDRFRKNGLYKGQQRGDMLDTAFFSSLSDAIYFHRSAKTAEERGEVHKVRNGFWVEVVQNLDRITDTSQHGNSQKQVDEEGRRALPINARSLKAVYHLQLQFKPIKEFRHENSPVIREDGVTFHTITGILCTELSSILLAVACGITHRFDGDHVRGSDLWIVGFFCIPMILKFIAVAFAVRREELKIDQPALDNPHGEPDLTADELDEQGDETTSRQSQRTTEREFLEVMSPSLANLIISMEPPLSDMSVQFFKHYGHPIRSGRDDRLRELVGIFVTYCFVLYFPIGLLLLSWMSEPIQYFWLGQQIYCVIVMHIIRLFGWGGCGRTEEAAARMLDRKGEVCLLAKQGYVKATITIDVVESVAMAKKRKAEILYGEKS